VDSHQHNTIVLVGSGTSLRDSNLGRIIDTFDNVVRFNEYQTEGYDQDVGSRITHWVRNDLVSNAARIGQNETLVAVPSFKRGTTLNYPVTGAEHQIPWDLEDSIRKLTGDWKDQWPSSGLLALAYFLRQFPHVHVAGFDGMRPDESQQFHYYGISCVSPHPQHLERSYVDIVCEQGRVTRLTEPEAPPETYVVHMKA